MQPPQDHDGFFSFTVPPKCPPALSHHHLHPHSHHHLSPILTNTPSVSLNPLFIDLDSRSPSGDSSISPRSASTHHRPSTAGPFAYNLPTNLSPSDPRPTSSAGLSLQQTTPPQPRPLARLSLSNLPTTASVQLQSAPPPFQYGPSASIPSQTYLCLCLTSIHLLFCSLHWLITGIGPHNTRPMTAPGAGWEAGQFNHDYDYGSASVGLFRNPRTLDMLFFLFFFFFWLLLPSFSSCHQPRTIHVLIETRVFSSLRSQPPAALEPRPGYHSL